VDAFVLLSPEGIPVRYHDSMSYEKALLYAGLITSYNVRVRHMLGLVLGADKLSNYRFRTNANKEIIVTVAGEYLLVVIQNCKKQ